MYFRTLIIFASLMLAMRLMGKRQLGEIELSELVVAVLISNVASHPLQDVGIPLMNGLQPIIILLCCELIMSGILVKSPKARLLICGRPSILISNGVINQLEMKKNRFTPDELAEELRNQGMLDISKVKYAILETDGRLNTVLFPLEQPVTAGQMNIAVEDCGYPFVLINNGRIMSDNLTACGKDEKWLKNQVRQRGTNDIKNIYLMTMNHGGQIYFAPKEAIK